MKLLQLSVTLCYACFLAGMARSQEPMPKAYTIPTLDLAGDLHRQVVVDREPGQYLGHPTTVLLKDNETMITVYPKGHGRGGIVMKRSEDAGLTWSQRLPVPDNWATSREVPTIHRVVDPDGVERLIMFSGLYPIRMAVSEDNGGTWSPLEPIGDYGGIVTMGSVVRLKNGDYLAMFHDDGRFIREDSRKENPPIFTLYQVISKDGGLTWSQPDAIYADHDVHLCEPGIIRSPDGTQLTALLRENSRTRNSYVIFSDDEGATWTEPRELPAALTGDRHTGKYAPDGRLFISFRDTTHESPTKGDWVAWVGRYEDILEGREGQYRVRLMDNHVNPRNQWNADCAYPGVEVLPDGTFVTTTYGHWDAGEDPYIVSVRLKLDELDALADEDSELALAWSDLPPLPDTEGFGGAFAGVHGGLLLVAGGANFPDGPPWENGEKAWYSTLFALESTGTNWNIDGPTTPSSAGLAYGASVSTAEHVLFFGGSNGERVEDEIHGFRRDDDHIVRSGGHTPMLVASTYHSAALARNRVYLAAGHENDDPTSMNHRFLQYDIDTDEWSDLPPWPGAARIKAVMAAEAGPNGNPCVFLFSGEIPERDADGEVQRRYLTDAYRFDTIENTWARITDVPHPIAAGTAIGIGRNTILCFSGSTGEHVSKPPQDQPEFPNIVLAYNTAEDRWYEAGQMPQGVVTTNAVRWGDRIVIPTGEIRPGVRTPRVQSLQVRWHPR